MHTYVIILVRACTHGGFIVWKLQEAVGSVHTPHFELPGSPGPVGLDFIVRILQEAVCSL